MFVQQADGTLKTLVLDWDLSRWVRRIEALDNAGVEPPIGPRQPYRTVRVVLLPLWSLCNHH
jgi:hypothetical protein